MAVKAKIQQLKLYPHQVRAWKSKRRVVAFVGGTGSGKCVKATDRIILADGTRRQAGDLIGTSFELLASTPNGQRTVIAHAELNSLSEPIWEMESETGKRVARNAEHLFWVAQAGKLSGRSPRVLVEGWKPISALRPGDLVASAQELCVDPQMDANIEEIKLLAYLIGDGCLVKSQSVNFTQANGFQLNEFAISAFRLDCWLSPSKSRPYDYGVVANRRGGDLSTRKANRVLDLVRNSGLSGSNSHTKHIPDFVFGLRRELVAIFLSRLFSTDGWAYAPSDSNRSSCPQIGYSSVSRRLIEDIQLLLLYWGIQSRIETKKASFTLSVSNVSSRAIFAREIGIYGKEIALAAVLARDSHSRPYSPRWRNLALPPGLRWEKVRSVQQGQEAATVAIEVPDGHEFLTAFREHNTWLGARWTARELLIPDNRIMCIGMGYERHVARVMMYELRKALKDWNIAYKVNEKKAEINIPRTGAQAIFGSADNPLSLEGPHVPKCWMDEAGLFPRLAWEVAQRRTGHANGQILITTIPYFEGWIKSDLWAPAVQHGDPDIEWVPCKASDNPGYSVEEIERMRRTMRADKFDIYYNGNWAKPAGLIWPDPPDHELVVDPVKEFAWNTGEHCECNGTICKGSIPCDWPAFAGHDQGFNAPMTGVWARLSPDDVLYLVADYSETQLTVDEHVANWLDMGLTGIDVAFGDPAAPEAWERANELGYPIVKANNNLPSGLDSVYGRLVTGRLKVFKGCESWLDARATYRWAVSPHDEEELLDRPMKPQPAEHLADATRYLCMGVQEYGQGAQATPMVITRRRHLLA